MNETDANQNELDDLRRQLAFMQEREELLGRINGSLRSLTDPEEIVRRAATFLGQHLAVNRCAYADVEGDQNTFNLFGDYNHGVPSMVGRYRFEDFSADCLAAMRAGEAFVVEDSETDPRLADVRENFRAAQIRSVVCVGLLKAGKFTAAMAIHSIEPRRWSEEEVEIVLSVANRCWESIERTRTLRELKKEREELIRRHSEIDKQRSEIESIYRTAPIGLALFDLDDYHYLRLNDRQAAFFGLKPEDVLGRTLMEMAPIPGLRELFDQVAQGGPPIVNFPLEGTLINDPDDFRYWLVSYFPVHDGEGKITGITAASLEITQQKRAELALIRNDKLAAVGRLASSIAHEINNPLEAVTNLIFLAETSESFDEARGYLRSADSELQRMSQITNQTLRFHRQPTSPTETTANELLDTTLSLYHGRLVNGSVRLQKKLRATAAIQCFEGEIRQVLANLIGNAIDAMPSGGTLCLRSRELTRDDRRWLQIMIADSGSGISEQHLRRIFEPFFTTKGDSGTGLGLWVSQDIMLRHGGKLLVRTSRDPRHHGTAFILSLPYDAVTR
ncbi:sensor histidine kinase [Granulicella cerasi]|uniref:sensor histidine kinase n=1 Tax=Granulicella cerasi TaxID=741063 RepID=UPI0021E08081|nr:sensor histidine kinase [Granulicella cerasi]